MKRLISAIIAMAALVVTPVHAADEIKVGFITTITGPAGVLGKEMVDAAKLAMAQNGGKLGGVPAELIIEDDGANPRMAVQKALKLIEKDKVHLLSGLIFGHVTHAVRSVALKKNIFTIATVGSTPSILGNECHKDWFTVSWIVDSMYEALAKHLNRKGVNTVFLMVPNYVAGKLVTTGFKRGFKGKIVGELYTKLNQPDYSVEIAQLRAKKPDAVVVFYPGGMGINFMKQYAGAGLKGRIPVYSSVFIADETVFPAIGDIVIGMETTSNWNPQLDNPANQKFVAAFRKEYGRTPTSMAAMGYDTIMLIDAAVGAVKGKVSDRDALRTALRNADFQSVRGPFKFNNNQFPIQNYYLNKVVKGSDGKPHNKLLGIAAENVDDVYANSCSMKW